MNVSVRTRFEIFKRDRFTCVYCGGHPRLDDALAELEDARAEILRIIVRRLREAAETE